MLTVVPETRAPEAFSVTRRLRSFVDAFAGIAFMLRTQHNAWIHAGISVAIMAMAIWLEVALRDACALITAAALVWMGEAMNTAIEALADAVHPDEHPLVGRAKDVAAGAVLIAAMAAAGIGLLILGPPLLRAILT